MLPDVKNIRWSFTRFGQELPAGNTEGEATMIIDFVDGRTVYVGTEQKLLTHGFPYVYLGETVEDDTSITLPADASDGRPDDLTMNGYTDKAELVQLVREFVSAVEDGSFAPRPIVNAEQDLEE